MQAPEDNPGGAGPGNGGLRTRSRRGKGDVSTVGGVGQQSSITQGPDPSLAVVEGQVQQAQQVSSVYARRHHFMEFSVDLPFLAYLDSRLANHCLRMLAQTVQEPVHIQFSISGTGMLVQMHSVDVNSLRTSTSCLLHELFLLMETMKHLNPTARGRLPFSNGA